MQQIWRHQRLRRDILRLTDGRSLQVLHPGFWNREAGPDFREAVLQFGEDRPIAGDIEIDREAGAWRSHRHVGNPAYDRVLLQVVWRTTPHEPKPPRLALESFLEAPLTELAGWLDEEAPIRLPSTDHGRCSAPLSMVTEGQTVELLEQAASVRLQRKAGEFAIRARHAGWEGALWEGMMAGLGYRHNSWPMRRIAEVACPRRDAASSGPLPALQQPVGWEARLLGIAGLLNDPGRQCSSNRYARLLWDAWWHERHQWENHLLPATAWRMAGVRPANHPQRRLALAARWMVGPDLIKALVSWITEPVESDHGLSELRVLLEPEETDDSFWKWHGTLKSATSLRPLAMLGDARTTDLAINIILPWLMARAQAGANREILGTIEKRYFAWPLSDDNAVLKRCRQRLLGGAGARRLPRRAALQQGLLQVGRDFCEPAGSLCTGCRFPEMVATVGTQGRMAQ